MKRFLAAGVAVALLAAVGTAAPPGGNLVVHEWGTFTSFAGSDGVCVGFTPDNSALPEFVYRTRGPISKDGRLLRDGTVSLETPVLYFYTDRPTRAAVRVDFPTGWVTEWFPAGTLARGADPRDDGRWVKWEVTLAPGARAQFPGGDRANAYDRARETDAVPVRADLPAADGRGPVGQWERFLFYRGVGTFPPPVAVRALGNGKVRVTNTGRDRVGGLVVVAARGGQVGFTPLPDLAAGAASEGAIPEPTADPAGLAARLAAGLTAAGLYPKEARAMVRTWEAAWFGEEGTRLMYLVPRGRTDDILRLTVEPTPAAVERVLVGRHEFLTPEREAEAERQVRAGPPGRELVGFGRFAPQARAIGERRAAARPDRR